MRRGARAIKRRIRVATIGALIVAGVTAGAWSGITLAGAQAEPIQLHAPAGAGVILDFDHDGRIDTGDRATGRTPLEDPTTGERVGTALFECVATTRIVIEQRKGTWLCTYVVELSEGHITLQGKDPAGVGTHVFAVTGGTGLYRSATGEATEVDTEDGEDLTIHLEP
jgi:hypothetical protein